MELLKKIVKLPDDINSNIYEYLDGIDCDMMARAVYPLYKIELNSGMLIDCIINNYVNILLYIWKVHEHDNKDDHRFSSELYAISAQRCQIDMFNTLIKIFENTTNSYNNILSYQEGLRGAVKSGNIDYLKYIINITPNAQQYISCHNAVYSRNINMLEYVLDIGCIPKTSTFVVIAETNSKNMFQLLIDKDSTYAKLINEDVLCTAIRYNRFTLLKMFYKAAHPYTPKITSMLTKFAIHNYKMFLWLVKKNFPVDNKSAINLAANYGYIPILQYFYDLPNFDRSKYFTENTLIHAISGPKSDEQTIDVLIWFELNNIKTYNSEMIIKAIIYNKPLTFEYLFKQGCPMPPNPLLKAVQCLYSQVGIKIIELMGCTEADKLFILSSKFQKLLPLQQYLINNF